MLDHVRSTIIEYLAGRFSADDLAARLPDAWELDEADASEDARTLTLKAVGCLAEYQAKDRSEAELRGALSALARKPARPVPGTRIKMHYVSPPAPTTLTPGAGKRPLVASV
jgi:hypothetical protein